MSTDTLQLTRQLIQCQSVTPSDDGCQAILAARLEQLGFVTETLIFEDEHGRVTNLWARKGTESPLCVFAGHTDVVPTGNLDKWTSDPFQPTERDGFLYGRGAADMKSSLAAFITAIERFVSHHESFTGSIGLLITSDEEGPATCGTKRVMETLASRGEQIDYCLVGEPSSTNQLGDTIKNGRRGSLGGHITVKGIQGHIAYPHLARNPNHACGEVINAITQIEWDTGNAYFPASSLQISNINGGTGATNVIPATVDIQFNIRYSTEINDTIIRQRLSESLNALDIDYDIDWNLSGEPFLTEQGALVAACQQAIKQELGITTALSTAGGTSDGRFIAPYNVQVVELGPINETIHKIDECVKIEDLEKLSKTYASILSLLLT